MKTYSSKSVKIYLKSASTEIYNWFKSASSENVVEIKKHGRLIIYCQNFLKICSSLTLQNH